MADDPGPIHLPQTDSSDPGPLRLAEPEVTTLIALWPGPVAPTQGEALAALESEAGASIEILGEIDGGEDSFLWNVVVQLPGAAAPVFLWSEPAKPLENGELGSADAAAEAAACRWVLGLQSVLDVADPLSSFTVLMRAVLTMCADSPAVLDVEAGKWHLRSALEELFLNDSIEAPGDVLWTIHAVGIDSEQEAGGGAGSGAGSGGGGGGRVWLHTHGLWRCGKPELEMLEVPVEHALAAGYVINGLAEQLLERELPGPGEPLEIGPDLQVAVQPWQEVAQFMDASVPGSMGDRREEDENPHTGVRAVICAPQPKGTLRKLWVWPEQVLHRLEHDGVVLYMTERATRRLTARAQATWPELAMAFSSLRAAAAGRSRANHDGHGDGPGPSEHQPTAAVPAGDESEPDALFLIKAGFRPPGSSDGPREHLWFDVRRFEGDRAHGRLVNTARGIAGMESGQMHWLPRTHVTDWQVLTSEGTFGPSDTGSLRAHVRRLVEQSEQTP